MTFISILIALLLERITPQFIELRQFNWLRDYGQWMSAVLHIERLGLWMGLIILLAPLIMVTWVLAAIFENALFGLFELVFNVIVVFFCLGPRDLDKQVDQYLDSIEIGEEQQRFASAGLLLNSNTETDLHNQVMQVCRSLFVEANLRIYAVLFWFVLLGPVAAVTYRLLEQWLRQSLLEPDLGGFRSLIQQISGWLDWIPVRLSLFAYMISGSFEDGLQAFRRGSVSAVTVYEQNSELLENVGMQSLSLSAPQDQSQAMDMVRKARGLILRSLIVWLLLVLLITLIS